MAVKCILTGQEKVNLSGDTMTGDLKVGSSSIGTNGYIEGTWLKTTAAGDKAGDFATIDNSGWIYKRKPADVLGDIGGQAKITASGFLKGDGTGVIAADKPVFWVTVTGTVASPIADKTPAEIYQAYEDGYAVYANTTLTGSSSSTNLKGLLPLTYIAGTAAQCAITFSSITGKEIKEVRYSPAIQKWEVPYSGVIAIKDDLPSTPSDIGAQPKITAKGFLRGNGAGNVVADRPYFPIIVTETRTPDDATHTYIYTYSADKTYQEIRTAIAQGYIPVAFLGSLWFYLSLDASYSSNYCFLTHQQSGGNYISDKLECFNDNTWTRESRTCISREGPFNNSSSLTLPEVIQTLENEIESIKEKTKTIFLPTTSWTGSDPYTQTVTSSFPTSAKVEIQPSETLYDQLVADNVGYLAIKNVDGVFTAVAKGGKPSVNLDVQVTYNNVY